MGGYISMGVRRGDGEFSTTCVSTNPIKRVVQDERFMKGSLEPINELLRRYLIPSENDSFGPQTTTPGEYGFILIDAVDRVIMNFNGFSELMSPLLINLGIDPRFRDTGFNISQDPETIKYRDFVRTYVEKIYTYSVHRGNTQRSEIPFEEFKDDQALIAFANTLPYNMNTWQTTFRLSSPYWTIHEFDFSSANGLNTLWSQVNRCTTLSEEENQAWERRYESLINT